MDVQKPGRQRRGVPGSVVGGRSPSSSTSAPAFFTHFAQGRLLRIFVQLDMPAQR